MRSAIILSLALAACSPAAPLADSIAYTFDPTSAERVFAETEFDVQRACVGAGSRTAQVTINVHDGFFDCGGIAANGCFETTGSIHVNRRLFAPALSHEYIHLWEAKLGHAPDYAHTGPIWAKCDRLNRPPAAQYAVTAYGIGCDAPGPRTKAGTLPVPDWTIAADPRVLPIGSIVRVEGLGERVVHDIGGGVRGRHIDLFMRTCGEARAWGRRLRWVSVLHRGGVR